MRKEQICTHHDRIIDWASNIYKLSTKYNDLSEEEMRNTLSEIGGIAWDIENEAEAAKERGQAMENRLYEYKYKIEELGFVRK